MAELAILSGAVVAAVLLTRPSAREHRKLKVIAEAACKESDSPESARSAFFRMAGTQDPRSQDTDGQAMVRNQSPQLAPVDGAPLSVPITRGIAHPKPERSSFVSEHLQESIDKKWEARKAKEESKYHKQCDTITRKYTKEPQEGPVDPALEGKRQKRQLKIDSKRVEKNKSLELKQCIESSLAEGKARHKAEKQQRKRMNVKELQPVGVRASTDGTGEQPNERWKRKPTRSSHHHSSHSSSPHVSRRSSPAGYMPSTSPTIPNMAMMSTIGSGAASVASMGPNFGGGPCGVGGC